MRTYAKDQRETTTDPNFLQTVAKHAAQLHGESPSIAVDTSAKSSALQRHQRIANNSPHAAQLRQQMEMMAGAFRSTASAPVQVRENSAPPSALQLKGKHKQQKGKHKQHVDAIDTSEHEGHQGNIQRKMVEVCKALLGDADELKDWFKNVVTNGLCGGWAALHRAAPDLLLDVWRTLEGWNESDGVDALTEEDQKKIVTVVTTAYDTMNALEPEAEYGESPEQVRELGEAVVPKHTSKVSSFTLSIPEAAGGGRLLLNKMLDEPKAKKAGNICTFHIETQRHHMSMRTRAVNGEVRILDMVESERRGVVIFPTTAEAIGVLDSGLYLALSNFKVEVEVFLDM
ncbi:hypothetical protein KW842_02995 [Duganella sp. sic0402]|uniref:hypothetical protein n=1 Tax=Duganella sp. sic0402 TaxID=2854786 RepID=UPI001C474DFE|nr:hypothetical protein [Duganella sp. sic0402]MBV7534725.1 hypothetical protein [Duganella sp. sic0402]